VREPRLERLAARVGTGGTFMNQFRPKITDKN
jgi:hypothetical protein